jgi:hypothetical protein
MTEDPADRAPAPGGIRPGLAGGIATAVGAAAAAGGWYAAPGAPWWMFPFLGAVAFVVVFRLLRPPARRVRWEDEL